MKTLVALLATTTFFIISCGAEEMPGSFGTGAKGEDNTEYCVSGNKCLFYNGDCTEYAGNNCVAWVGETWVSFKEVDWQSWCSTRTAIEEAWSESCEQMGGTYQNRGD